MIRFLIKSVFWLSLAFLIMPRLVGSHEEMPPRSSPDTVQKQASASSPDMVSTRLPDVKAIAELGNFCMKNAALCDVGKNALVNAGSEALKSSGAALEFLSDHFGNKPAIKTDPTLPPTNLIATPAIPIPTPRAQPQHQR